MGAVSDIIVAVDIVNKCLKLENIRVVICFDRSLAGYRMVELVEYLQLRVMLAVDEILGKLGNYICGIFVSENNGDALDSDIRRNIWLNAETKRVDFINIRRQRIELVIRKQDVDRFEKHLCIESVGLILDLLENIALVRSVLVEKEHLIPCLRDYIGLEQLAYDDGLDRFFVAFLNYLRSALEACI